MSTERGGADKRRRGIGTRAVHGNGGPQQGPLTTPIVQSSTFVFDSAAEMRRMLEGDRELAFEFYTRYGNPTLRALEEAVAVLEGAEAGVVFASGMAAAHAVLELVPPNGVIAIPHNCYLGVAEAVDHLIIGASDLDRGIAWLEQRTGVSRTR